jgi:hypothetical protein
VEDYVFRFEVPVDDIVVVHELHGIAHLLDDRPDFVLGHGTTESEVLVEIAAPAQLHQKVEVVVLDEG